MIPFVIEMRGQAQVSSKQTAQTQKRLDELSKRRPEVHPAVNDLCTSCVQEGGFEGPENGPKQRRINNRLLSYRPQHRRGNVHNYLIVRWFSVFRNCAESALRYKTATFPIHLLCTIANSRFLPSWNIQPTKRQDVLAKLESAMF